MIEFKSGVKDYLFKLASYPEISYNGLEVVMNIDIREDEKEDI